MAYGIDYLVPFAIWGGMAITCYAVSCVDLHVVILDMETDGEPFHPITDDDFLHHNFDLFLESLEYEKEYDQSIADED